MGPIIPKNRVFSTPGAKLAPELVEGVTSLARTLVAAARHWTLYPEQHPAVRASFDRLAHAIQEVTNDEVFSIGVTPDNLMIESFPVPSTTPDCRGGPASPRSRPDSLDVLRQCAGRRDLEAVAHAGARSGGAPPAWRTGGPVARGWSTVSISLEQIDFAQRARRQGRALGADARRSLEVDRAVDCHRARKRWTKWRSCGCWPSRGDPLQIGELATAVMAPKCTADGAPMITTQAATVLAAFRHLASIVSVKADRIGATVMRNLATAAATPRPARRHGNAAERRRPRRCVQVVQGMTRRVRRHEGGAACSRRRCRPTVRRPAGWRRSSTPSRPMPERKKRVLTMTRTMLSESTFGQIQAVQGDLESSMEELLISYNDKPFVSKQYRSQLDGATARGEAIALKDLPEEMSEWAESLGQQSVRKLSVVLIIDLLKLEREAERAAEIADDMTGTGRRPADGGRLLGRAQRRRKRSLNGASNTTVHRSRHLPRGARATRHLGGHARIGGDDRRFDDEQPRDVRRHLPARRRAGRRGPRA